MEIFIRILKGFALGLVQGLTEFLPVSSSGHLLLIEKLGVAPPSVATNLFLHIATLFVVLITMRKSVFDLIRHPFGKKAVWIYIVCIPTAVIGIIFKLFFEDILLGKYLSLCFLITALLLLTANGTRFNPKRNLGAFLTGIVQGLAVLPGISRSGSTISAMTYMNYSKEEATELSFLMSIPVILGGTVLEIKDITFADVDIIMLVTAFLTAFISGFFAIKVMLKNFHIAKTPFAIYLLIISVLNTCIDVFKV